MDTQRIESLAAEFADRAVEAERLERLPQATVAELRRLELPRLLMPRRWNGCEGDVGELLGAVRVLARGCMSTAWCAGIFAEHPWVLAHFDPRAQEDVWTASQDVFISLSNAPTATATPVSGGFRLNGQWRFASGCDYAEWFVLLAGWEDQRRFFLLPAADVTIDHGSWKVSGLRATGSKTVAVADALVPGHRAWDPAANPPPGITPDLPPLFHQPVGATLGLALAAVALGGAEAALEHFRERTRVRVMHLQGQLQAEDAAAQLDLAEAAVNVESARLLLYHCCELGREAGLRRAGMTPLELAELRVMKAHVVRQCAAAVDRLFAASGGGALLESTPLQRIWRDVHAVQAHASMSWGGHARNYGSLSLGLPATSRQLF